MNVREMIAKVAWFVTTLGGAVLVAALAIDSYRYETVPWSDDATEGLLMAIAVGSMLVILGPALFLAKADFTSRRSVAGFFALLGIALIVSAFIARIAIAGALGFLLL